jgi:hypothetical protein
LKKPRVGIAIDSDVVDLIEVDARFVETVTDGHGGKSSPVFDAPEALLLRRGDEFAVDENARSGVGVMRIDAEDDH